MPFGANDFIEYWSAFQITLQGGNPYLPSAMLEVQRAIEPERTVPLMMWNPPWLLVFLCPLLFFPFASSTKLFLVVNIFLWMASTLLVCSAIGVARKSRIKLIYASVLFFPSWYALQLGQIGLLLGFVSSLFFWAWLKDKKLLAGASLALMSVKPHLFLLVVLYVLWNSIRRKDFSVLLSAVASFCLLVTVSYLCLPSAYAGWWGLVSGGSSVEGVPKVSEWRVATLSGAIRGWTQTSSGQTSLLPMVLVPGLTALGLLTHLIRKRENSPTGGGLAALFALSFFTAPFGWLFDAATLLPAQLSLAHQGRAGLATAVGLNLLVFFLQAFVYQYHHQAWWFAGLLFLAIVVCNSVRQSDFR